MEKRSRAPGRCHEWATDGRVFLVRILAAGPAAARHLPWVSAEEALPVERWAQREVPDERGGFKGREPLHLGGRRGWGGAEWATCPAVRQAPGVGLAPVVPCPLGLFLRWAPADLLASAAQCGDLLRVGAGPGLCGHPIGLKISSVPPQPWRSSSCSHLTDEKTKSQRWCDLCRVGSGSAAGAH